MGLLSWLFPSDQDRLDRAKARIERGEYESALKDLLHCKLPEAEALYDKASDLLSKKERVLLKKQMANQGFHGFRVDVTITNAKVKAEIEAVVMEEMRKAGVDLEMPDFDEEAAKKAIDRASRRVKNRTREPGMIRLVPIKPPKA
jgi:hypothetical protein